MGETVVVVVGGGGGVNVPLKLYRFSLLGPPQYSEAFPLHSTLHPLAPSGASVPPFEIVLPHPDVIISPEY